MKKSILWLLVMCLALIVVPFTAYASEEMGASEASSVAETSANVAKVGNTEYATIDEAIANWTNGTTLTLLSDVTLSDVVKLSSTEYHILDLGTYTMTAAKNKDAIQYVINGRSSAGYALDIKADATNPGGITATGGSVVRHTKPSTGAPSKDRPITRFYGGVFNASYVVRQGGTFGSGYTGASAPYFYFYGGEFNGTIYTNRSMNQFYGGVFTGSLQMSVDSSAYTLIAGGTFKNLSNMMGSALNQDKFTIGSAKGVYDREVYIDENGNYVIAAALPSQGIAASVVKTPGTNDYLKYSKVGVEGKLVYTSAEVALKNNTSATVTVYADAFDMTGISFKGTIVVPAGNTVKITNAPEGLAVKDSNGKTLFADYNDVYGNPMPTVSGSNASDNIEDEVEFEVEITDNGNGVYDIELKDENSFSFPENGVEMSFPVTDAAENAPAFVIHEHKIADGVYENYIYVGKVSGGNITFHNNVGFSTFTVYEGGLDEALAKMQDGDTIVILSDIIAGANAFIELNGKKNITITAVAGVVINGDISIGYHASHIDSIDRTDSALTIDGLTVNGTLTVCSNDANFVVVNNKAAQLTVKTYREGMNITLSGNAIDGAIGAATNSYGMFIIPNATAYSLNVTDNTFENVSSHAFVIQGGGDGGVATYANSISLTNNEFLSWGLGGKDDRAAFKIWNDTKYAPASGSNVNETTNAMRELVNAIEAGNNVFASTADNTVELDIYDIAADAIEIPDPVYIAEIDGVKYDTLQDAINAAEAGDVIVILADTIDFAENAASIVIDKEITIKGLGADATTLNFNSATSAFVIASGNVTFADMTITQGSKSNSFHISISKGAWDAPAIQYANITIQNINFVGGNYALCLIGENVVVDSCAFNGQSSHNIVVYSLKGDSKITNNVFNASTGNNKSAILYEGGVSTTLTGDALAAFMGGGTLTISGNEANAKGVFFQFTQWMYVKDMNLIIADNKIDGITNKAIALYDMDGAITAAGDEFASIVIDNNSFTNTKTGKPIIKEYTGAFVVEMTKNYFGSEAPDLAALVLGDKVVVKNYYADAEMTNLVDLAVAKIGDTLYYSFADALAAASTLTGDVTIEIYGKVTLAQSLSGSYDTITFIGKTDDAEIYLDVQGYITASGKKVAFEDLKLSKVAGGYMDNAGFMNLAFGVYDVVEVTYTNCIFLNGAYASSGTVLFDGCTFYRSHDRYGMWAYGNVDVTVQNSVFDDIRGIKMYAEGGEKVTNLTVTNTDFTKADQKPAIVLTYGQSVTLSGNTYPVKGVFELDLAGAPNGTPVTSDVPPTCVNDNGVCGVLVDGKIYTTVAQAAEVATAGSNVTLLHDSTETVELAMGVNLDKNGFEAAGVSVAVPVAMVDGVEYATLSEAFAAVTDDSQTVVILTDVTENLVGAYLRGNIVTDNGAKVTITLTNSDWVYCPYTFVLGENITLKVPSLFYYAGGAVINGTVIANAYYQRYAGTKLTINEPGSMTVLTETFILRYMDGDPNAGIYINGDNDPSTVGLKLAVAYFYRV